MRFTSSIVVLLFFSPSLFAQDVRFERLTIEDGLSQSSIFSITKDTQGFLWLGTLDGLNRYDGYSFQVLKHHPGDSLSPSANNVWKMFSSSTGKILAGYQGGTLDCINTTTLRAQHLSTTPYKGSSAINTVRDFCEDREGNVWVGLESGLLKYDRTFTSPKFYHVSSDSSKWIPLYVSHLDAEGKIWVAAKDHIYRFDRYREKFNPVAISDSSKTKLSQKLFTWATIDRHGVVWLGGEYRGIYYFDKKHNLIKPISLSGSLSALRTVSRYHVPLFDRSGAMWLGTDVGLMRLHVRYDADDNPTIVAAERFAHDPLNPYSLSHNNVLSLYEDDENILWVGTSSGLNKLCLSSKKFSTIKHNPHDAHSISDGNVWTFLEDHQGRLLVGTQDGLSIREKGVAPFSHVPEFRPINLAEDSGGTLWISTRNGMRRWNPAQKTSELIYDSTTQFSESANFINQAIVDNDGTLWWGSSFGLVRYDSQTKKLKRYFSDSSFVGTYLWYVMALCQTRNGAIWFGTNNGGLICLDPKSEKYLRYVSEPYNPFSLSNNVVSCIVEASDGTLWVGTLGGGLNKAERVGKDSLRFIHYQEEQGLSNNFVYGIIEDSRGNLWMSTNKGLSRFFSSTKVFRNYNVNDGLQSNEFNQNAFYKGRSGKIYFGGINGFNEFYPDSIVDSEFIPPIAITQFKIFDDDKSELLSDSIVRLSYNQNFFSFEFSALSFFAPNNNHYAYKLEELDAEWVQAGSKRFARYTHLDPGEYIFRVKGTNNDGVWNERGASIRIIISPPWWATVWFKLFAAFGFIGSISSGAWYISRKKLKQRIRELEHERALMEERQRTREQIARDLHDDVASTLSSITLYSETVRNRPKKRLSDLESAIERLSALSYEAKLSMEEVLWSLSPRHDTLKNLVDRIGDVATQLCYDHSLQCRLDLCDIPADIMISEDIRKNIYLLFKEAMSNIFKHSDATSVELQSQIKSGLLHLSIHDNGKGIQKSSAKERTTGGHGLTNMKVRAEKIGAVFQIDSSKDKGLTISLQVKMTQLRH